MHLLTNGTAHGISTTIKVNTDEKQHAILPLEGEEESARLKVEMEPHEFMIMNESGDGTAMDITLNNYRVNKDEIIF